MRYTEHHVSTTFCSTTHSRKVEQAEWGDPGCWSGGSSQKSVDSTYFMLHNANKHSITLNVKTDEGKALFQELVQKADVVVNNLQSGDLERLGWSYDFLKEANPSLIYVTISGFGAAGPYSEFPYTATIAEAPRGGRKAVHRLDHAAYQVRGVCSAWPSGRPLWGDT